MNMKAAKKMKGTLNMCHSTASTAVCMSQDYRSVVGPPRRNTKLVDHVRLVKNKNYIRLGKQCPVRRSFCVSSLKKDQQKVPQQATSSTTTTSSSTTSSEAISDNVFQVVVMRVSIHCQGCAGKLKKHLSKMEGVTSFSIDLESKRVTVKGHVSPSGVLESVSKVKKAEFWPC